MSEQREVFIYGLMDPTTEEIRYIGKSVEPETRFRSHCNDNRVGIYNSRWIQKLARQGLSPRLEILEIIPPGGDWQGAEKRWIAKGRSLGWRLTNITDGGEGVVGVWKGRKHQPESLVKIGNASKGRLHSPEYKDYMKTLMTGRNITWGDKISQANRKLTDRQVRVIRKMLARGLLLKEIASRFDVHWTTISNIKRGLFYTDVV